MRFSDLDSVDLRALGAYDASLHQQLREMAAPVLHPDTWTTPPLLWIVIDDPGGRHLTCCGHHPV